MKIIGITPRLISNKEYPEIRDALDIKWAELCSQLNYLPIIIPHNTKIGDYYSKVKLDGIILSGGNDLYSINSSNESKMRDIHEKNIIKFALKNKIPLMGICRGMQLLAEWFGCDFKHIDNHVAVRHSLSVNKNSIYKELLEKLPDVNSYHNYALDMINDDDIIVSARAVSDNTIEAFEHKRLKVFAQMWHSEREKPFSGLELEIIQKFFGDE